jgi:hypothetical protein
VSASAWSAAPSRYAVVPNPRRAFEVPLRAGHGQRRRNRVPRRAARRRHMGRGDARARSRSRCRRRRTATPPRCSAPGMRGCFRASAPRPRNRSRRIERAPPTGHGSAFRRSRQSYRSQIARHDYPSAYAELTRNPAVAGDTVDDLLVAADVARLSDHPAEAMPIPAAHPARPPTRRARANGGVHAGPHSERARAARAMRWRSSRACAPAGRGVRSPRTRWCARRKPRPRSATSRPPSAWRRSTIVAYPDGRRRAEVRRYARLE